jgi:hypothetical protein
MRHSPVLAALSILVAACGTGRTGSPACGLAQAVGPTVILEQLQDPRMVVTEVPRGLPASLPARVVGQAQSKAMVGYDQAHNLALGFQGTGLGFPLAGAGGYGLLVMDDTSRRVQGVLVYVSPAPNNYPQLGTISDQQTSIPLYGVRVDWSGVSNPKCPLLGDSVRTAR